jgi:hypothetical protein
MLHINPSVYFISQKLLKQLFFYYEERNKNLLLILHIVGMQ